MAHRLTLNAFLSVLRRCYLRLCLQRAATSPHEVGPHGGRWSCPCRAFEPQVPSGARGVGSSPSFYHMLVLPPDEDVRIPRPWWNSCRPIE